MPYHNRGWEKGRSLNQNIQFKASEKAKNRPDDLVLKLN
jgi:hypothetical protein